MTARYWVPYLLLLSTIYHYLPLFATIRDCSPLFALFVLFAILYSGLFAVLYSRLFAIRYSGFPATPPLQRNLRLTLSIFLQLFIEKGVSVKSKINTQQLIQINNFFGLNAAFSPKWQLLCQSWFYKLLSPVPLPKLWVQAAVCFIEVSNVSSFSVPLLVDEWHFHFAFIQASRQTAFRLFNSAIQYLLSIQSKVDQTKHLNDHLCKCSLSGEKFESIHVFFNPFFSELKKKYSLVQLFYLQKWHLPLILLQTEQHAMPSKNPE